MVPGLAKKLFRGLHRTSSQRTGLRAKGHLILRESKKSLAVVALRRSPVFLENPWFVVRLSSSVGNGRFLGHRGSSGRTLLLNPERSRTNLMTKTGHSTLPE